MPPLPEDPVPVPTKCRLSKTLPRKIPDSFAQAQIVPVTAGLLGWLRYDADWEHAPCAKQGWRAPTGGTERSCRGAHADSILTCPRSLIVLPDGHGHRGILTLSRHRDRRRALVKGCYNSSCSHTRNGGVARRPRRVRRSLGGVVGKVNSRVQRQRLPCAKGTAPPPITSPVTVGGGGVVGVVGVVGVSDPQPADTSNRATATNRISIDTPD